MFCKNCGYELSSNSKFCPNCGKNLENQTIVNKVTTSSNYDEIMGILSLVLTFIIPPVGFILAIIGVCTINDQKYKKLSKIALIIQIVIIALFVFIFLICLILMMISPNILFPYGL